MWRDARKQALPAVEMKFCSSMTSPMRHEQTLALVQKADMTAVRTEMFVPGGKPMSCDNTIMP